MNTDMAGAILAGGKNARMGGRNKAFIQREGIPIIQRTVKIFKELFEEVILVTNSPGDYELYKKGVILITDRVKDIGPLGGIYSALVTTKKSAVFFVACDMPFLHNAIILQEIDYFNKINCDALVPRIGPLIEPLCAVYKTNLKGKLCQYLDNNSNYSIKNFLKTVDVYYLDLDDNPFNQSVFKNLNTPEDLRRIAGYHGN